MIDLGMSRKEYYEFLKEVERDIYDPVDFTPFDDFEIYTDKTGTFTFTPYRGNKHKSYSQPMMELKDDACTAEKRGYTCFRCEGSSVFDPNLDEVIRVNSYPSYATGLKRPKPIFFNRTFAARRPHP